MSALEWRPNTSGMSYAEVSEHFKAISFDQNKYLERQRGDELHVLLHVPTVRDSVAFEELEVSGEKIGTEPDRRERAKQTLVIVIGHPTSVLDLRS